MTSEVGKLISNGIKNLVLEDQPKPERTSRVRMNLCKGDSINLSKTHGSIMSFAVGLNWEQEDIDCDVSIVLLDSEGYPIDGVTRVFDEKGKSSMQPNCLVYYKNMKVDGIMSYGDDLDGGGDIANPTDSNEQIDIDISKVLPEVAQIMVVATTHSEVNMMASTPILFGTINKPTLTLFDNTNPNSVEALMDFELDRSSAQATAVEIAAIVKKDNEWHYEARGNALGKEAFGIQSVLDYYKI